MQASPSVVRQAPDHKTLRKTTILKVEGAVLSTPPIAQEYFEPGVNTKLNRRAKPKTNYTLPSDMPELPLGFVPTNQTPGAAGEEPPIVVVKESQPADLMQVFARINAEQKMIETQPKYGVDVGSMVAREFGQAMRMKAMENKVESMMREGFTEAETAKAMGAVREEEAVRKAKEPAKPISVEQALKETFAIGVGTEAPSRGEMEVQTELSMEGGKEIYARAPRRTAEEVAFERARTEAGQTSITKFFGKK